MPDLYIGLMSGTSLDGVDGVLTSFGGYATDVLVLGHAYTAFTPGLAQELLALNSPGGINELHRSACCANEIARLYAGVVHDLLLASGQPAHRIKAIGAHGQTVRHHPQAIAAAANQATDRMAPGYTVQLNNPALLAELTNINVVADFRSRDVAAGGQGAPLVPAFHQEVFGSRQDALAVLNIGGFSNVSLIDASGSGDATLLGFDCGPGNVLMDLWCQRHTGQAYDKDGSWGASGHVCDALLTRLWAEPYFSEPPPKSTGRDLFSPDWLAARLAGFEHLAPADVQACLVALTAQSCASDIKRYGKNSKALIVCGGGALNLHLMKLLQQCLPEMPVRCSSEFGLPPLQVEAAAFAWLARKTMHRETGSLPKVTGATGARILGAIYPA